MEMNCPSCQRPVTTNTCCEIRGALAYHLGCAPTSAGAPRTIWQALLTLCGCRS